MHLTGNIRPPIAVGNKLDELTGSDYEDHLGRFHAWLTVQGINPETEHGWGTPEYFDDELMQQYAEEFKAKRRNK